MLYNHNKVLDMSDPDSCMCVKEPKFDADKVYEAFTQAVTKS